MGRDASSKAHTVVFPYLGTPEQNHQLALFTAAWQSGAQPFWSFAQTQEMLARQSCLAYFAAADAAGEWLGAMLLEVTDDVIDLLYIYVPVLHRRAGIGHQLLAGLRPHACSAGLGTAVILEVRPSNVGALALYKQFGFVEVGRRKNYYGNGEDALVLKHFGQEESCPSP